jgi:hypothetical protein
MAAYNFGISEPPQTRHPSRVELVRSLCKHCKAQRRKDENKCKELSQAFANGLAACLLASHADSAE